MESEAAVDAPAAAAPKPARSTKVRVPRQQLAPRGSAAAARNRRLPAAIASESQRALAML